MLQKSFVWQVIALLIPLFAEAQQEGPTVEPNPGVNNVIFVLLRGDAAVQSFAESNRCLHRALAGDEAYDQVAFHEGDLNASVQNALISETPSLKLVDVSSAFIMPPGVTLPLQLGESDVGYRHMVHSPQNFTLLGVTISHTQACLHCR